RPLRERPPEAPAAGRDAPLYVPLDGPALPSAIQISRRKAPDVVNARVMRAYDAYASGDMATAEREYREVLRQKPENRDALLGLAAIATSRGDSATAHAIYQRLLRMNPRDTVASAALFSLQRGASPDVDETRVKLLLDQEPNAGHLHFALGNLYARQNRWAEAQAAYFEAVRCDSRNPDYAYNLAVSLDHLGKGAVAANYYREAVALAE